MDHGAYKEMLSALLDGELHSAAREAALAHMEACADCRAYFSELTALRAALGELEEFDAPDGFAAGVMARIRAGDMTARTRAGDAIAPPHAENTSKTAKKRAFAALAACAAVVLLAVYALPNALRMGGSSVARDSAIQAAPSAAAPAGASGAPDAPAADPELAPQDPPGYSYAYEDGIGDDADSMRSESARVEERGREDTKTPNPSNGAMANGASNATADALPNEAAADKHYAATGTDNAMPIADEGETPMMPLSRPQAWGDEYPVLTLSGEGAESWLAEHGWQGESGVWYADAAALRALPEDLTVLYSELSQDYDGAVLVELWEAEP